MCFLLHSTMPRKKNQWLQSHSKVYTKSFTKVAFRTQFRIALRSNQQVSTRPSNLNSTKFHFTEKEKKIIMYGWALTLGKHCTLYTYKLLSQIYRTNKIIYSIIICDINFPSKSVWNIFENRVFHRKKYSQSWRCVVNIRDAEYIVYIPR